MTAATADLTRARLIPARNGVAARLKAGETVTVVNTHGKQVVDTWAFTPATPASSCRWSTAAHRCCG